MVGAIVLSVEQYECLRGHLNAIENILGGQGKIGSAAKDRRVSNLKPRETKQQGVERYKKLIESGARVKKPNHLKK